MRHLSRQNLSLQKKVQELNFKRKKSYISLILKKKQGPAVTRTPNLSLHKKQRYPGEVGNNVQVVTNQYQSSISCNKKDLRQKSIVPDYKTLALAGIKKKLEKN